MPRQARLGLEPAHTIISILGGPSVVAEICELKRVQVWRWTQPKGKGGTGGLIPQKHHAIILTHARDHKLPITVQSFQQLVKVVGEANSARQNSGVSRAVAETPYGKWISDALATNPNLSKSGLSQHLRHGTDRSRVLKMISGARRIQIDEIAEIAAYLGVPPPSLPFRADAAVETISCLGIIATGVWHEAGHAPMRRQVAVPADPRQSATLQGYYVMDINCSGEGLLIGDCLISLPLAGNSALASGEMCVVQRKRDNLHQLGLARASRNLFELTPLTGSPDPSASPIARVIGVYRPLGNGL